MKKILTFVVVSSLVFGAATLATHAKTGSSLSESTVSSKNKNAETARTYTESPYVSQQSHDVQTTLGVRISGLVCDLCVHGIEEQLKTLPFVHEAKAFPKDGVVFLALEGGKPDPGKVADILVAQGYAVHNLTLASAGIKEAVSNPKAFSEILWKNGAEEQKIFMSDEKNRNPTCNAKKNANFSSYSNAW